MKPCWMRSQLHLSVAGVEDAAGAAEEAQEHQLRLLQARIAGDRLQHVRPDLRMPPAEVPDSPAMRQQVTTGMLRCLLISTHQGLSCPERDMIVSARGFWTDTNGGLGPAEH